MHKKIIVSLALDHGISQEALAMARHLKGDDGEIQAVHVHESPNSSVNAYVSEDIMRQAVDAAREKLAARVADTPDVEPVMLHGSPGQALTEYAKKIGADCIIVGSHKPGLSDYFLGSTSSRVVRHAPCSVYVIR
ncbi:universal stress protein [Roseobacter sinensis]|uniref:Universal stress protein n=1 Tax=Roseobacter sinensis TaxID=2931391 RepID=A0ABT3BJS3_9RHOB|nr:universal stress protein [Roseobacter sp. WL0113]MCV3273827.1 universal stress protein [Roseobacter sp. WL0113]